MEKFNVEFYEDTKGNKPVQQFMSKLNQKMHSKLVGLLNVLSENGNALREPYSKHLEDGIFEVRVSVGNDITRVLYFFYYGKKIIVTNGFIKKTNKTPRREIEVAKNRRRDYLERNV